MSYQQLISLINNLTERLNQIEQNSKRIFELPQQNPIDGDSKFAVSRPLEVGEITEYMTLKNILEYSIEELQNIQNATRLVQMLPPELLTEPNRIKIPVEDLESNEVPIVYRILGVEYVIDTEQEHEIPDTDTDLYRIDLILGTQAGTTIRFAGTEGEVAIEPIQPENTVLLAKYTVFNSSISEPEIPTIGDHFVKKAKWFEIKEVGNDEPITTLTEYERHFIINGYTGTGDVSGFILSYPTDVYYDMVVSIWNRSGATLPLPHDDTQGGFYFPNAETYNLPDNAVITFRVDNFLRLIPISLYPVSNSEMTGIFNRVINIPFSEFGDDWENVTKENVAEKINDLEITQAQNEVHYFVVDDSILPPPVEYNFDVEVEDVSDVMGYDFNEQSDFEQFLNVLGFVVYTVSGYTVTDNRVQCNVNIEDDLENFEFEIPEIGITKIRDFSFIENIYGIDSSINLTDNQINDVSGLASLSDLVKLNLSGNQISDLTGLSGLSNLESLDLLANHISDISELGSLTNLTWLRLDNNQISDLTGLSNLISLNELSLNYNEITSSGWDSGLYWAENVAPIGGFISTSDNTNPITGTDFETALVNKSWTIIT